MSVADRTAGPRTRVAVVTNIPTPYRIPVYDLLSDVRDFDVRVFYFAEREFDREWVLQHPRVESVVLPSTTIHWRGRDIHFSRGVWKQLNRFRPDVVLTNGFNPALLVAFAWAVVHGVRHVAQTDGTPDLERRLGTVHRVVRRVVSRRSATTIAASRAGLELLTRWGARPETRFLSALAVDNTRFRTDPLAERDLDVLVSGRLDDRKNPLFALQAAADAAERLGRRLTVAMLGDGPLRPEVEAFGRAHTDHIELMLPGFLQQDELPGWYRRARTFLFPTREDAWGLVVNEAAAAGVPQLVSVEAGAKELVSEGESGHVLPLEHDAWVDALVAVLRDESGRVEMGRAAVRAVAPYTYEAAARGLEDAIRMAGVDTRRGRPARGNGAQRFGSASARS